MALTAKQQIQVQAASPQAKAAMRSVFERQNKGQVPGRPRDQKQASRRSPNMARLHGMPRAQTVPRGIMPDMTKGSWSQTPASSNVMAPRGFGYYDAFAHDPFSVATHTSIGPATPIVGTTICSTGLVTKSPSTLQTSGLEAGAILLVVYPATDDAQAVAYECNGNLDATQIISVGYFSPQLQADPPSNAIPTRCSLRIRNWTQHIGTGGIVRTLRMTTGVTLQGGVTSNLQLAGLMEGIRSHTRTRTYGGEELCDTHQKNCSVVDQSKATWFTDWQASAAAFNAQIQEPSYTPIAILFEPFVAAVSGGVVGNKYEVNVRSQFLAHYAQGTMLANMAIDPPNDPGTLSKHRDREEGKGSMFEQVGSAIRDGASWAWNHKADIAPAGYAAWKFASPYLSAMPKVVL